jgi:hypothetical protein
MKQSLKWYEFLLFAVIIIPVAILAAGIMIVAKIKVPSDYIPMDD